MNPSIASADAAAGQINPSNWSGAGARAADGVATQIQFISFAIGDDQYGVDIMAVREIKGWSEITHLPRQPEYVRGVLNLRGAIVPIVDLRCRFGQGLTETTPLHIVIIVQIGGRQVGLIGDRVLDIVSVDASQIQQVPRRLSTPRTYSGCFGRWVMSDQPLISRTAMMSTPYWSSPMAKLMNWVFVATARAPAPFQSFGLSWPAVASGEAAA